MIKNGCYSQVDPGLCFGACLGLLAVSKKQCEILNFYSKSTPNSDEEEGWWQLYDECCLEVEEYKNLLPSDIVDMIITHSKNSGKCEQSAWFDQNGRYI